jgi:O-antigen/teichoic acid export membrane protein
LSGIKKLAGQTLWYGGSTIFGRFLNYLLNPLLAQLFASAQFGIISNLFAIAAFLNIIFTYGLETSYFRFNNIHPEKKVYNTVTASLLTTTVLFGLILFACNQFIASNLLELPNHPEYVQWLIVIVMFDALSVLPLAKLRYEGRPVKFAAVRIITIVLNIGLILFFLVYCDNLYKKGEDSFWLNLYNPDIGVGYVIISNMIASGIGLLLLSRELFQFTFQFDKELWKKIMSYTWPLIIVGFGGMVNEVIDRFMILHRYPGTTTEAYSQVGIYSANYKLAVLIVLFIQAFRMGAEPFFFKASTGENAPRTYARVMKFFIITCCFCFLGVVLFLDIWKYFMGTRYPEYYTGLKIVPVIMLAKIFLGAYYNLSVWYKLTNRNLTGAYITIGGAIITIVFNYFFIPILGYVACAITTVLCYGFMMITSYRLGQRHYPIPYPLKKLTAYVVICLLIFGIHQLVRYFSSTVLLTHIAGIILLSGFALLILKVEKKEFQRLPYLGRFLYRTPKTAVD